MSTIKTLALATVLVFGASQLAVAQYGSSPPSGGSDSTMSGSKAQKNTNGSTKKNTGTGSSSGQDQD